MTYFIGICGPAGVGKNTFARCLTRQLLEDVGGAHGMPLHWELFEDYIAQPAYELVAGMTGLHVVDLMNRRIKDTAWTTETAPYRELVGWSPRDMLWDVLMHLREIYGEAMPVRGLKARASGRHGICLVTDVRTNEEAQEMDGTIELSREGVTYRGGHTESGIRAPTFKVALKTTGVGEMLSMADFPAIARSVVKLCVAKEIL